MVQFFIQKGQVTSSWFAVYNAAGLAEFSGNLHSRRHCIIAADLKQLASIKSPLTL
jgi:hypothetical protein